MSVDSLKAPAGLCKIAILVLGIVVMGVGLHSHFESPWKKNKGYVLCDVPGIKKCPSISMENYYVAMIIICFILSIASLAVTALLDSSERVIKLVDMGYHGVAALLLLIAAIVYMVSAEQINDISGCSKNLVHKEICKKLLRSEKLAAGALTLFQTVLYGVTAFLLTK